MSDSKTAQDFVKYILDQICEDKAAVLIEQRTDEMGMLISVTVAEDDMGKLIGKQGQTISALRTLVRIIGAREDERINLKVLEPSS